jgi:hypothetical protein
MSANKALLCLVAALCIGLACSYDRALSVDSSGSGTLTTNGIRISSRNSALRGNVFTILADSSQEIPARGMGISLQVFRSDYQPYDYKGFSATMTLDSTGSFEYDSLESGSYNVLSYDTVNAVGVFIANIPVGDSIRDYSLKQLFDSLGIIKGSVNSISTMESNYRGVYITGTPFFTLTDSAGAFSLMRIPMGAYEVKTDFFSKTRNFGYTRIKGYLSPVDTLVVYTDSARVNMSSDSLMQYIKLSF